MIASPRTWLRKESWKRKLRSYCLSSTKSCLITCSKLPPPLRSSSLPLTLSRSWWTKTWSSRRTWWSSGCKPTSGRSTKWKHFMSTNLPNWRRSFTIFRGSTAKRRNRRIKSYRKLCRRSRNPKRIKLIQLSKTMKKKKIWPIKVLLFPNNTLSQKYKFQQETKIVLRNRTGSLKKAWIYHQLISNI